MHGSGDGVFFFFIGKKKGKEEVSVNPVITAVWFIVVPIDPNEKGIIRHLPQTDKHAKEELAVYCSEINHRPAPRGGKIMHGLKEDYCQATPGTHHADWKSCCRSLSYLLPSRFIRLKPEEPTCGVMSWAGVKAQWWRVVSWLFLWPSNAADDTLGLSLPTHHLGGRTFISPRGKHWSLFQHYHGKLLSMGVSSEGGKRPVVIWAAGMC